MRALDIKLFRDLRRLWAQALAIALVIAAGVATLVVGVGAYDSLSRTRADYYDANGFADVFANATRAPRALVAEIAAIDGVAEVQARITRLALLDIAGMREPASAMLVSLPDFGPQQLDRTYLRLGRLPAPDSATEVVISERFAAAHGFRPGARFGMLINGTRRDVRVTGIALSPEFIYALGPGDLMPDERRFGIVWMSERSLAAAYNLRGAFSNVILKLLPGTSQRAVIARLDRLLAPYGGQGAYGRDSQQSHAFLDAELKQLQSISWVLPPIFLLVAAFLVNMTLSRLIALEREQIGLLKALGYSSWAIARHYIGFVSLIALIGVVIGSVGGTWLGIEITRIYARYYAFPYLIFSRDPAVYVLAAGITLASALLGAIRAAIGAARLPPAVAMSPPAPPHYRKLLRGWLDYARFASQSVVMTVRHLMRWPWRTAGGVLGVAMAVAVLVGSLWTFGSTEFLIDHTFFRAARQDASISFTSPRPMAALFALARLPAVRRAEPFRTVAVSIRNGPIERRIAITGRQAGADLTRVIDQQARVVSLPPFGLVISAALAGVLHLQRGDRVTVSLLEGDRRTVEVPIAGVVESYLGLGAYMDLEALNRLVGEGAMISGAEISLDPRGQDALFAALKETPSAGFITLERASLAQFRATLAQNVAVMTTVYVSFAAIIAFGVIYNFARISLSEQGRELASLRVLGFTRAEVSALLLGEIAAVVLVAQPVGWIIGYGIAALAAIGFSTELYRVPLVVGPDVYAWSSLAVVGAGVVSALIVRRRVDRLDLVAVLKTRE